MTALSTNSGNILVVDDDHVIRDIIVTIVSALGYTCQSAADGLEAVELLAKNSFSVVITDMMMPKMDGMQLLAHIKEHYAGTDVVVITGHSDTYIYSNIIDAGGTDFIIKPFEGDELEAKLSRVFRERRLIQGLEKEIVDRKEAERNLLAAKIDVENANLLKDRLIDDLYGTMDEMLANRDHYTFEHALRVAEISRRIGEIMGIAEEEIDVLVRACLVHDIGKIAIPDDVLLKPGQFDVEDHEIMKVHPSIGANLFSRKHHDERIALIIRHHHERLDGTGYPDGLSGDELGPLVRIVAVADIYEALISRRPYKKPMSKKDALKILAADIARKRVDGRVVEALCEVLKGWDPLTIVRELPATYMMELEIFRQKAYFREPLTGFFNYRYIYFLNDRNELLHSHYSHYQLLITNFQKIQSFYKKMGQVLTDQVLDDVGQKFYDSVEKFNSCTGDGSPSRMFRRGADYLFYIVGASKENQKLIREISDHLRKAEEEWGVSAKPDSKEFAMGYPIDQALGELFRSSV